MNPDSSRTFALRAALIGLAVFAVLATVNRTMLFSEPWHEMADYAVDAFRIERARHFDELYGNYSRFGFYHPGPAFYYVYALGDQVFYRWLHWVPSPYNAHALAGVMLQSCFFGATLAMLRSWLRGPLFIPLLLAASALHLALAQNAFVSIWPPRVLLMPYFCLLVGAASVACGRMQHLPLAVLAACFLVHGHVAQPLFVVTLFALAYGLAWRRNWRESGRLGALIRTHALVHVASAVCILLFIAPLAIDLGRGAEGNLARILEFEASSPPSKPLWKALAYFGAYFGYVKNTDELISMIAGGRATNVEHHMAGYFVWAGIIIAGLIKAWRTWSRETTPERPFLLALTAFILISVGLSLVWGVKQTWRMFEFNGYFNYAILNSILIVPCAALGAFPLPRPRLVGALLCALAVFLTWHGRQDPSRWEYWANEIPPATRRALAADPRPDARKYLLFTHENWAFAVSTGLALQREGREFRADADWGPKFIPGGAFEPAPPEFSMAEVSTWRLSRRGPADAGIRLLGDLRVYFEPLPLDPAHAVIDCSERGNLELYNLFGFASPFGPGTWTSRPYAGLVFASPPVSSDVSVTILAEPFLVPGRVSAQPLALSVNGRLVATGTLAKPGALAARVPAEVWNLRSPVAMVLHLPAAVSERELRQSLDEKKRGWRVERIVFGAGH